MKLKKILNEIQVSRAPRPPILGKLYYLKAIYYNRDHNFGGFGDFNYEYKYKYVGKTKNERSFTFERADNYWYVLPIVTHYVPAERKYYEAYKLVK